MIRTAVLGACLFVFWLALSGHTTPFLLAMGVLSVLLTVVLIRRMDGIDDETVPLQLRPRLVAYWIWLAVEIVKSNVAVSRIILSRKPALAQRFILVPTSQTSDMGRVIFANSITLTPGTVTVETEERRFIVHAINEAAADLTALADMDRRANGAEARP